MPAGGTFLPVELTRSHRGLIRCIRAVARAGVQPDDIRTVVHRDKPIRADAFLLAASRRSAR